MEVWISPLFQPSQPLAPNVPYMALGEWLSFQAVLPLKGIKEPTVFSVFVKNKVPGVPMAPGSQHSEGSYYFCRIYKGEVVFSPGCNPKF